MDYQEQAFKALRDANTAVGREAGASSRQTALGTIWVVSVVTMLVLAIVYGLANIATAIRELSDAGK